MTTQAEIRALVYDRRMTLGHMDTCLIRIEEYLLRKSNLHGKILRAQLEVMDSTKSVIDAASLVTEITSHANLVANKERTMNPDII